jgi:hypothetical protein
MVIANPIYDVVFKRLMENERVAKFFIGTLLEQTIENITVRPQEYTYTAEIDGLSRLALCRLDYIAAVRTREGELKKILIEVQKAKNLMDVMRFRTYLAQQYQKRDLIDGKETTLPITTIYILGFNLPEIETACISVGREYRDMIHKKPITTKSDFVEQLSHDTYIVQVCRITNRYQTRLDQLLSVFEQNYFVDEKEIIKRYNHWFDPLDENMKTVTDILHYIGTEPDERTEIEKEQEAFRIINAYIEDSKNNLIREQAKTIAEQEKAIAEQSKEIELLKQHVSQLMKREE